VQEGQSEGVPEEGGLLSMMATVMVRLLWGRIPMAAQVGACTVEGVLLEIVYFPNYAKQRAMLAMVQHNILKVSTKHPIETHIHHFNG